MNNVTLISLLNCFGTIINFCSIFHAEKIADEDWNQCASLWSLLRYNSNWCLRPHTRVRFSAHLNAPYCKNFFDTKLNKWFSYGVSLLLNIFWRFWIEFEPKFFLKTKGKIVIWRPKRFQTLFRDLLLNKLHTLATKNEKWRPLKPHRFQRPLQ